MISASLVNCPYDLKFSRLLVVLFCCLSPDIQVQLLLECLLNLCIRKLMYIDRFRGEMSKCYTMELYSYC